ALADEPLALLPHADPFGRRLVGGQSGHVAAVHRHGSRQHRGQYARDRRHQRRLARAVASEHHLELSGLHFQVDVAEDDQILITAPEPFHVQHCHWGPPVFSGVVPKYSVATSWLSRISAGVPSSSVAPRESTWTRSASRMTRGKLCSTRMTVTPASRIRRSRSSSRSRSPSSRPEPTRPAAGPT